MLQKLRAQALRSTKEPHAIYTGDLLSGARECQRGQLAHLEAEAALLLAEPLIQPPAAPWRKSLQTRKQEVPSGRPASKGSLF